MLDFEKFELQRAFGLGDRAKPFKLVSSTEVRITQQFAIGFIGNSEGTEQNRSN